MTNPVEVMARALQEAGLDWSSYHPQRLIDALTAAGWRLVQEATEDYSLEWIEECAKWRGRTLTGDYAHFCWRWDGLPIDETCSEWPCGCFEGSQGEDGADRCE